MFDGPWKPVCEGIGLEDDGSAEALPVRHGCDDRAESP